MVGGAYRSLALRTYGKFSPSHVARILSCTRAPCELRWYSDSITYADNGKAAAKPLSAMPTPKGALPLLGHQLILRKHNDNISNMFDHFFGVLGPIYRLKLPAGAYHGTYD